MRIFKRVLAVALVCMMILPLGISSFAAWNLDDAVTVNWTPMAAKYSKGTWKIIAPKSENYEIRTNNFGFSKDADGGVKITTPTYKEFAGTYGVSAIASKATTALDGLSVVIQPDEYDSYIDSIEAGNSLNILWTEDKIDTLADFNDASKAYDTGLASAVEAYSNGLRHIIRPANSEVKLTPASKAPAGATNGKALMVRVTCDQPIGDDLAPVATSVSIIYYDGYYINDDGHPGYRWTFTAKNHEDGKLGDASDISTGFESIDLSNGLAVNVRADETLGFIVNINGYDYCNGEEVAFFPDCDTNWVGYSTNNLKDEQILNEDPIWTTSMTYARADIDLSGLKDVAAGYVMVGAVSNNDQTAEDHRCNYTVETINGVPAAEWKGETTPAHECNFELVGTIGTTCTRDGRDYYRCTVCGAADNRNIQPAFGHTPKEDITEILKPTCSTYGTSTRVCFVCRMRLETYHTEPIAHTFTTDWTIVEEATCEKDGKRTNTCSVCSAAVEEVITAEHNYEWVVTKEATCLEAGEKTGVCKTCGADSGTVEIPVSGAHSFEASVPVIETIDGATDWFGKVAGTCTVCGEVAESTEDMYGIVKHFTDVKENHWFMSEVAFCVRQGYVSGMTETTFAPNANLTRAQFLTLLAKFDGVDLTQYEGKDAGFSDVKPSHWWNEVINWAVENEYTSGIGDGKFGPSNNITRAQLARFFYVYTEKKGLDVSKTADISAFPDASKVQSWAEVPVKWAVAENLIAGMNGNLAPNGNATRAQAARIFMMYANTDFAPVACEHVWGEWVVTTEPQVGVAGEETATCTLCGETKTQPIDPLPVVCEHVWGDWTETAKATHTADGEETRTCTLCNEVETNVIPAHEADNTIRLFLDPADVENGAKIDGTDATELLLPICYGEDYNDFIGDMPTASMEGYEFVGWYLENYGFMMIQAEWDNGTYAVPGDCELYAIFEEVVVPCEHVWGDWAETAKATHTVDGEETRTCTLCGEVETNVIPAHTADYTIRFFLEDFDVEEGAKIDGTDATELLLPICYGEDYNDYIGDFPTVTKEGYIFVGWYIESLNFLMTEGEWNGNYYAITFDCEGYALFEEAPVELPVYDDENSPFGYLAVGTYDYDLSADYQYTIYEFSPEEEGLYTITANDSLVGIASYNGMWVSIEPSADTVNAASVEWECTSVGQSIWVSVKGGAATANITVEYEIGGDDPEYPIYETYTNVALPESVVLPEGTFVNVAYNDETVDTAVLGEDGFYHLNSVDGAILYVNLADSTMNLSDAMSYGQLKGATWEDGILKVITDYNEAYQAYIDVAADGYAPLTEDLMVILKEVGANQGWYGEGGWVASTEDAWMFACYYVEVAAPVYTFTLNFVADADAAIVNDAALTYTMNLGDKYSDYITELPVAEKEGYVFLGWYNREYRIMLNPDFDAEKVLELYLGNVGSEKDISEVESTLELIPLWDTEGEKDWVLTFVNWDNEDFETIEIGANVGDSYMSLFAGNYPDPGLKILDFGDGDLYEFVGWCIEHPDVGVFLLTEGDMWDLGYLALAGNWEFYALYELI
ncbi:MAG: S-layer homology domain-containing protein [Clostridia bacterium]|nr:S-layer homology domain-containing protein [Clostridia bacterium]